MRSTSPPTGLNVVETGWPTIEVFADLESTTAVAQTCRALHRIIVDADSRQLRASHFEVENTPCEPPASGDGPPRNWRTAPARIPHYLSRALNALHFPALRRLRLDFPAARRRRATGGRGDVVDDAAAVGFPVFASKLAAARGLEALRLDAGRLVATEPSGRLEAACEIFGDNLGRCARLRRLEVRNAGFVRGVARPLYSVALLRALLPTLRKRRLEELTILLEGTPSDVIHSRQLSANGIDPVLDFFGAALSAEQLLNLNLSMAISMSHLTALIRAAAIHEGPKPTRLRKLRLNYDQQALISPPIEGVTAAPILDHFSFCDHLESIFLNLPRECWEGAESLQALGRLLRSKPHLSSLTISFSFFSDGSGKMVKAIADCIAPNISDNTLRSIFIVGLLNANEADVRQLQFSLEHQGGMICDKLNVDTHQTTGGAKKCNVMLMSYLRVLHDSGNV